MKKVFSLLAIFTVLTSCSLKYGSDANSENTLPDFTFNDVTFTRYEKSEKKIKVEAEQLEQYEKGNSTYGKDVSFSMYDGEKIETEGSCSFLGVDTDNEIYELYEDIKIRNEKQNMDVIGNKFRMNGKSEQLTSGKDDSVTIKKEGMTIHGSGFSASGVSSSFSFSGAVSGTIETEDEGEL